MNLLRKIFVILIFHVGFTLPLFYECPSEWESFDERCYHFVFYPTKTYNAAQEECQNHGATLLSIDDENEHKFILRHLDTNDKQRHDWFTSGVKSSSALLGFVWEGSSTQFKNPTFWLSDKDKTLRGKYLVYHYSGTEYGWSITEEGRSLPYICEIPKVESYRILQVERGYDYGLLEFDPEFIPRGPVFTVVPEDTTVLVKTPSVFLECVVDSYPLASYGWMKNGEVIDPSANANYTLSNGRLTIKNPSEEADAGEYQCVATNTIGTILSTPVRLSFGALGEFSPVKNAATYAAEYEGTALVCPHIAVAKPGLAYQWYKYPLDFVRPSMKPYAFISANGKLYFSQVTRHDIGEYNCMITLVNNGGSDNYIGAKQNPGRISTGLLLSVANHGARNFAPQIQDDFIFIHPSRPLRGQTLTLECFAYGTGPLEYSWRRYGVGLPKTAKLTDFNRKLTIVNAQLEDSGIYNCRVDGQETSTMDEKNYTLTIQAEPFFTFPLKNQFVDIGSQLTWRCIARAKPEPSYKWYKNGELVKTSSDIIVNGNVLIILQLDPEKHNGMYQCAAKNLYGLTFSSAELRVLAIPPSFIKRPVEPVTLAALNGNVTILCSPEAAPYPEIDKITWKKNELSLNLPVESNARISKLKNGNLFINGALKTDEGRYSCHAENDLGAAESSGMLMVKEQPVISRPPTNTVINVNGTAFLYCSASIASDLDVQYDWFIGTRHIDVEHDPHFGRGINKEYGGLYIRSAQFGHAGTYSCNVRTPIDTVTATAFVTVIGPPGQPGKPFRDNEVYLSDRSIRIRWADGSDHGSKIMFYVVEGKTNYSDSWEVIKGRVSEQKATDEGNMDVGLKATVLENLKPGASYRFRLRTGNQYGIGEAGRQSEWYAIPGASPEKVPDHIGGGGGKVGLLTITWEPLPLDDQYGYGIGYIVYWRKKPLISTDETRWQTRRINGNVGKHVALVGVENYYLEYQIQVQPFNVFGDGFKSPIQTIYSAEGMPLGVPQNVYINPFNSTAMEIVWNPVPDTRVAMRGKLLGYKVNYWLKETQVEQDAVTAIYYGQRESALIIGLDPDTWYYVNVQTFSQAGNGPRSEMYQQPTDRSFPVEFPTWVRVHSHSENSVSVSFRGVLTTINEEGLRGYTVRYWRAGDDARLGTDVLFGRTNHGVVRGLEKGVLYQLRVYGFNSGGIGMMSSPATYFTLGGEVRIDPTITQIVALACIANYSILLLLSSLVIGCFFVHNCV